MPRFLCSVSSSQKLAGLVGYIYSAISWGLIVLFLLVRVMMVEKLTQGFIVHSRLFFSLGDYSGRHPPFTGWENWKVFPLHLNFLSVVQARPAGRLCCRLCERRDAAVLHQNSRLPELLFLHDFPLLFHLFGSFRSGFYAFSGWSRKGFHLGSCFRSRVATGGGVRIFFFQLIPDTSNSVTIRLGSTSYFLFPSPL